MKVPASTIHNATVLKAMIEIKNQGIEQPTANQVSEMLMRPKNFDMGGKLYGLCKKNPPLLTKYDDSHFNTYQLTEDGEQYYRLNSHKAQRFGEYDAIGEAATVNDAPASIAIKAAEEMQKIISTHTNLRVQLQRFYNSVIELERDLDE